MRANHFTQISKPKSVKKISKQNFDFVQDTQNGCAVSIGQFNYIDVKNYDNLNALPYAFATDFDVLQWACALLSESLVGRALLQEAEQTGWSLSAGQLDHEGFHVNTIDKIIELDFYGMNPQALGQSTHYKYNFICVLAKALRDIWHEERWGDFEENYKPESVLLLERARAADADCLSILIAWELRGNGYDEVWRHVLAGDDGDIAQVLVNIINRYPSAQYNGLVLAHLFRQWYSDTDRLDAQDHNTLQHMDDVLEENDIRFGGKKLNAQEFEFLSMLPDGNAYLETLGQTVATDPFFNGLSDPVNQSHLFQIIYDNKVTYVQDIPFRDAKLARKFKK